MYSQSKGLRFNREASQNAIAETIQDGFYYADLFENKKVEPVLYHYIITRNGSSDVLDWGQAFSLSSMREQANGWLAKRGERAA